MRNGRRLLGLTLTGVGLLTLAIGVADARTFPRANPSLLSPGIREEGRYTQAISGTYGKLWPLPGLFPGKGGGGGVVTAGYTSGPGCSTGSELSPASPLRASSRPSPLALRVPVASEGGYSGASLPIANVSSGGAGAGRVDTLENDLRDIARKLNSK